MAQDRRHMWRALELARRGQPWVAPNPMVGAVVALEDVAVGEGFHESFGGAHAEVTALRVAGIRAGGATLYTTLEPCCEEYAGKKTPACVPQILSSGIKRVVIATEDPNPRVRGRGAQMLQQAGLQVEIGQCEEEARELNAAYFTHTQRGRPLVTAKWAMTLDGKIATRTGDARWISGELARREVHYDRGCAGAIIVGAGTIRRDDPMLTARGDVGRQPVRVVVDPRAETPPGSNLLKTVEQGPVFIYAGDDVKPEKLKALEAPGAYVILLQKHGRHLRWVEIMQDLGERGVTSAIIEGGGGIFASAFRERAIDRLKIFIAPKIFGGQSATTPVEGPGVPNVERAVTFDHVKTRTVGPDVVIEGHVVYPEETGPSPSGHWVGYEEQ